MLHVAFLRSPHAHAEILSVDVSAAPRCDPVWSRSSPPRISATTGNRDRCWCRRRPSQVWSSISACQVPLAKGKVRHVGEPVVMVVAESRYVAEDAVGDIMVDWRCPAGGRATSRPRSQPGAPLRARRPARQPRRADLRQAKGDYAAARARAAAPGISGASATTTAPSAPIETRGIVADWDREGRPADGLGHDPGADRRSATAWPACSASRSSRCA